MKDVKDMTPFERHINFTYRYDYKKGYKGLRYAKFYCKSFPIVSLLIEWFIYKYHKNRYKRTSKNWYFKGSDNVEVISSYKYISKKIYENRKRHIKPLKIKEVKEIKNGARQTYVYWTESEIKEEYSSRWEVPINKDWRFLTDKGAETTLEQIYSK